MIRLFLPPEQFDVASNTARITGQDHLHITRVLRARPGEQLILLDGLGAAYLAEIDRIEKRESSARIVRPVEAPPEPAIYISVMQALGKADKFDQVVQHGTEAGASAFAAIAASRSVIDLPADRAASRTARWSAIAKGAAEQSHRARVPQVSGPVTLADAFRLAASDGSLALILHAASPALSLRFTLERLAAAPRKVYLFVGPEGGWSAAEMNGAAEHGLQPVSLGPHVLRTETAALVAISQLLYHYPRPEETRRCAS